MAVQIQFNLKVYKYIGTWIILSNFGYKRELWIERIERINRVYESQVRLKIELFHYENIFVIISKINF